MFFFHLHLLVSTNKITIILINRITALFHVWAPCCHTVHYRIIVQDYHSCLVRTCRFHIVRHWVGPFSIIFQRAVTPTELNWSPKCNKKGKVRYNSKGQVIPRRFLQDFSILFFHTMKIGPKKAHHCAGVLSWDGVLGKESVCEVVTVDCHHTYVTDTS